MYLYLGGRFDHKLFYRGAIRPANFSLGADLTGADLAKGQFVYNSHTPHHALKSSGNSLLIVPRTRLKNYGDKAFAKTAPELWNNLPINLRSCKSVNSFTKRLKTHLFKKSYGI